MKPETVDHIVQHSHIVRENALRAELAIATSEESKKALLRQLKSLNSPQIIDRVRKFILETLAELDQIPANDESCPEDEMIVQEFLHEDDGVPADPNAKAEAIKRLCGVLKWNYEEGDEDEVIEEMSVPEIDRPGDYGYTPLMAAVVDEDIEEVKRLIASGANQLIIDNGGHTPKEKAIALGLPEIAELLK